MEVDLWSTSTFVLALVVLAPLVTVLVGLADAGPRWDHVQSTVLPTYILNTVVLVVLVSALSFLMAIPAAWLVSAFDFPGRRVFDWALVMPLAIPTYVAAFVYLQVPEAAIPILIGIRSTFGLEAFALAETTLRYGVLSLFMAGVLYPYLYLTARASFSQQRGGVIEAAQSLGRNPRSVFFSVALPMARPAMVAGLGLIVMEVINDYGAVNLFGVPTLTEGIFRTWFGLGDRASALRIAGLTMFAVLAALWIERSQRGRTRYADSARDTGLMTMRRLRGGKAAAAVTVCGIPLVIGFLFPLGQLAVWGWATFAEVVNATFLQQLGRSLTLSVITAVVLTSIAVLFAYATKLHPTGWLHSASRLAALGYAAPGAVVAVGVMVSFGALDGWISGAVLEEPGLLVSGTVFAIGFAYVVRFLAVPFQPVQAGMTRVCGTLDEASRVLGRGPGRTLLGINLPLLRGTIAAATMLAFVDILKELPLTLILRPANFETLATTAFGLAKEGRILESSVPSLIIVAAAGMGLFVLNRYLQRDQA